MSEKLKPCPMECVLEPQIESSLGEWFVRCPNCMVSGPLCASGTEAIAAWDNLPRRAASHVRETRGAPTGNVDQRIAAWERAMHDGVPDSYRAAWVSGYRQCDADVELRMEVPAESHQDHHRREAMSEKLKPCPFCGSVGMVHQDIDAPGWYAVECCAKMPVDCNAEGPPRRSEAEAIAAWNRRAPQSEPLRSQNATGTHQRDDLPMVPQSEDVENSLERQLRLSEWTRQNEWPEWLRKHQGIKAAVRSMLADAYMVGWQDRDNGGTAPQAVRWLDGGGVRMGLNELAAAGVNRSQWRPPGDHAFRNCTGGWCLICGYAEDAHSPAPPEAP